MSSCENREVVFLGVDWSIPDTPFVRLSGMRTEDRSYLIPLAELFSFRCIEPERIYCSGWFDLTGKSPVHVNCASWNRILRGKQCPSCAAREGFLSAHQAHLNSAGLASNVRGYLQQPHWLYLDTFPDGAIKIGTAAQSRKKSRLAEQGAVAAYYIARSSNGLDIRTAESALAQRLSLPQSVSKKRKIAGLSQGRVSMPDLQEALLKYRNTVMADIRRTLSGVPGIDIVDGLDEWSAEVVSKNAFAATPAHIYERDLRSNAHAMRVIGVVGSLIVFNFPTDTDISYVADLGVIQGLRLELGDFKVEPEAIQVSLF